MSLSRTCEASTSGTPTQILLQQYVDRVLVIASQIDRPGVLFQASLPATVPLQSAPQGDSGQPRFPPPSPGIQLTPLLGSTPSEHLQVLYSLYAAQIASLVWAADSDGNVDPVRPKVVVSLALKVDPDQDEQKEKSDFTAIMSAVQALLRGDP